MSGAQIACAHQIEHIVRQLQQTHQIGDVAAAFCQRSGQFLLGVAEPVHQLPIACGLFHRVQIGALDVLDDRDFKHFGVGIIANQNRKLDAAAPSALRASGVRPRQSRNCLVSLGLLPHDQGLDNTFFADRCGQFLQLFGAEQAARLIRVGIDLLDRHEHVAASACRRIGLLLRWGNIGHQARKAHAQARVEFAVYLP